MKDDVSITADSNNNIILFVGILMKMYGLGYTIHVSCVGDGKTYVYAIILISSVV